MARSLTLSLVQTQPVLGDLPANLDHILKMIAEAALRGAQLIVFPELALTGYHQELLGNRLVQLALTTQDEPLQCLAQAAARAGAYVIAGFIEKRRIPGVVYNSIVLCGPDGSILGSYAKSHLFATEKIHFRNGDAIRVFHTGFGALGPMICMDIGFPEVARILCLEGAELLVAPSAWIREDADIWPRLLQARALDNIAFTAGINRAGVEGNLHFIGKSMLVGPRGDILAELDGAADILTATIDLDEVIEARRRAPRFTGRRPELYASIADPAAN